METIKYYNTEGCEFITDNIETSDGYTVLFYYPEDFQQEDIETLKKNNEYFHFNPESPFEGAHFKSAYQGKLPLKFFIDLGNEGNLIEIYDSKTKKIIAPRIEGVHYSKDGDLDYWKSILSKEYLVEEYERR